MHSADQPGAGAAPVAAPPSAQTVQHVELLRVLYGQQQPRVHCAAWQQQTPPPLVLDTRPAAACAAARLRGAVGIPLDVLERRCYLLPDKGASFLVVAPAASDYVMVADAAQHAQQLPSGATAVFLRGHTCLRAWLADRWPAATVVVDAPALWRAAAIQGLLEQGPPSRRRCLFAPSPLLASTIALVEEAAAAAAAVHCSGDGDSEQPLVLRALDIGCGSGRDLAWLAAGCAAAQQQQQMQQQTQTQQQHRVVQWHVTGADSWLAALQRAHDLAGAMGLGQQQLTLMYCSIDSTSGELRLQRLPAKSALNAAAHARVVSSDGDGTAAAAAAVLEPGSFDLVLCVRILERALLPRLRALLRPGGFLLYSTFQDGPGLRAFGRPAGHEHVLQPGELATAHFGPHQGFRVLRDDVSLTDDGRELCMFVAQRCDDDG